MTTSLMMVVFLVSCLATVIVKFLGSSLFAVVDYFVISPSTTQTKNHESKKDEKIKKTGKQTT